MKNKGILLLLLMMNVSLFSQNRFMTKEGFVSFFSHTLVEDIKADNTQVLSIVDADTGEIAIQLLMRSFQFKKALMQQHFNDSYVESHKFPKAKFRGFIINLDSLVNGYTETQIKGTLNVHGKDKEIEVPAKIFRSDDELRITGGFTVEVADFDIKIPAVVRNNIAKTIKVTFNLAHEPYNN